MTPRGRAAALCLSLTALVAPAPAAERIPALDQTWRWVSNERFELLTNGSERRGRQVLEHLEAFRRAIIQLNGGRLAEPTTPIRVAIFERAWHFAPYLPIRLRQRPELVGGYFLARGDTYFIAMTSEWREAVPRIILHEYTHFLVASELGRMPAWLSEGLAEYFSAFRYLERERRVEIGRPIPEHMQLLNRSPHFPLAKALEVGPGELSSLDETTRQLVYAKSWLLVHYLRTGSLQEGGTLSRFGRNLASGLPQRQALEAAAGRSLEKLDDELFAYQRKSLVGYSAFQLEMPVDAGAIEARRATPEEAIYRLGEFLAALGPETRDEAAAHFAAAGRPAPEETSAIAGSSPTAIATGIADPVDAPPPVILAPASLASLRDAVAGGRASALDKEQLGRAVRELASRDWESAKAYLPAARSGLRGVLVASPRQAELAQLLIWLYRAEQTPADLGEGLAAFEQALAAAPEVGWLHAGLARLRLASGDAAGARATAEAALSLVSAPPERAELERLLVEIDEGEARRLREAGHPEDARRLLEERLAAATEESGRADAVRALEAIQFELGGDAVEGRYRAAVALVNAQRVVEGAEALRRFIRDHPGTMWTEVARQDLERVEAYLERRRTRGLPRVEAPDSPPPPPGS